MPLIAVLLFSFFLCAASVQAQPSPSASSSVCSNQLSPQEQSAGWRLLFDGRSLAGWDDPKQKTPPGGSWAVENGCLTSQSGQRIREDLVSLEQFGDFELQFTWKLSPGGNSGLKYRIQERVFMQQSRLKPNAKRYEEMLDYELENHPSSRNKLGPEEKAEDFVLGFEYQLIDNERHKDGQRGPLYQTGALYSMIPATRPAAKTVGEWNQSRLVVRGKHIEHWLNGVKVLNSSLDAPAVEQGLAKRYGTSSHTYRLLHGQPHQKTPIVLQHHGDPVWFCNLKIKPL